MDQRHARALFGAVLACAVALAAPRADAADLLRLHGSNTIGQRLAPALVEAWAAQRGLEAARTSGADQELTLDLYGPGQALRVEIHAHGTGTGYGDLLDGRCDLWMASRPAAAAEIESARSLGRLDAPDQEHVIAIDGLAIIVHPANPLARLTLAQARDVFAGRIRDWAQLGAAAGPIAVYARDDKSGTYDTFKALVLRDATLVGSAQRYESTDSLSGAVATDHRAIGFVGLAGVGASKPLALSDQGTEPLQPTQLTVATEDYVLSRRLFLYSRNDASTGAREFIEFVQSAAGQAVVERIGFVAQHVAALDVAPRRGVPAEYLDLTAGAQRLSVNFRFGSGLTLLDNKALRDIDRVASFVRERGGLLDVLLIGFADGNETNPYQALTLSTERADYVALELLRRGVGPRRVRGMGPAAPVASDANPQGRAKNRRVELWVQPSTLTAQSAGSR